MSTTLVGVFVSVGEAREASRRLGVAGIAPGAIRLSQGAWAGQASVDVEHGRNAIGSFLLDLFDMHSAGSDHVSEAGRRTHLVLTVDIAEVHRIDEVGDILEHCGAVDVDDRFGGRHVPAGGADDLATWISGGRRDYVRHTEFDGVALDALPHHCINAGVERRAGTGVYRGLERRARA